MSRFTTTAATRALCGLGGVALWTFLPVSPAAAAQAPSTAAPVVVATQQTPAAAPDDGGVEWATGWSYGVRGALSLLRQESLDPGFGFSGFAVLPLSTDFEIEGEVGYQTMNTVTNGLPAGRLSMFPLRATLRLQLWRFGGAKPYVGAGGGVYLNRFSLDPSVLEDLAAVGFAASATVDPGFGFHGAAGVEWQRDRIHFGVDVKYVLGETDAVSTVVDQVAEQVFRETSKLDLDGFWIAAGIRFNF